MATDRQRDAPWMMRTYSGHSTARASNELYRTNLAQGQTGLSIAFDLPTQTGYDPDAPEAAGEVGKVGVPVAHLGHMRELLDQIPVADMNTSMTINATAAWLLGLYVAHAQDKGVDPARLAGTTQNDIVKEYLSRGTYIFPPGPSLRLTVDTIAYTVRHAPRWNPINVCSYHLQEAGATPTQEIAYALGDRHRRARRRARLGQDRPGRTARGGRPHQLLRELQRPLRRGDLQDAGLHRHVGPHLPRALRRRGPQAPPLPLRRAGQLARPHRATAGEQRAADRPRDPRRHAVQERTCPGHAAARLERGARAAPTLGPAVVSAHTAGPRVRVRRARVRRHLRGLGGDRGEDGRSDGGRLGGAGRGGGARRGLRGDRRAQATPGAQPGRARAPHRDGGAGGGRRELLSTRPRPHRCSATASSRTSSRSTTGSRPSRSPTSGAGGPAATAPPSARHSTSCAGSRPTTGPGATS